MNLLFSFLGLLCGIFCLVLALIALIFGKIKIHRILTIFNVSVAIWGLGYFIVGKSSIESDALFGWRFSQICFVKQIKMIDVMTPLSLEKWLGATEGAVFDFPCSPNKMLLNRLKHKTPIKNLYQVGAKTFPGQGIVGAVWSGVCVADILLKGNLTLGKFAIVNT